MSLALAGQTILVTRPRHQAGELARRLEEHGANVWLLAAIAIVPPESSGPLDAALRSLDSFDWIVMTSANGVESVRTRMLELGVPEQAMSSRRLAVIGPATASALEDAFRAPDAMPEEFVSERIADALGDVRGQRILLARADIARRDLSEILSQRGADVVEVAAYRIEPAMDDADLPETAPDYITLTSSAVARATVENLSRLHRGHWLDQSALVSIGPITSRTIREMGWEPAAEALPYTEEGLIKAILRNAGSEEVVRV